MFQKFYYQDLVVKIFAQFDKCCSCLFSRMLYIHQLLQIECILQNLTYTVSLDNRPLKHSVHEGGIPETELTLLSLHQKCKT